MRRRSMLAGSLTAAGALGLAACGQGENPADGNAGGQDGGSGDGSGEVRFAWWGSDFTTRVTQGAIDAFEAEHSDITVTPEAIGWDGYWDRLATTAAAGDLPDVINMDETYLATYAEQGSLLDLSTLSNLDTSDIDPTVASTGQVSGGELYGVPNAVNALCMITNVTLLEEAGLEVPDDTTWTWDEFAELSQAVTEATGDGIWGIQGWGQMQGDLFTWTNQVGEPLWTEDGTFGISEETLAQWWEFIIDLEQRGAMPPPATMEEIRAAGNESSGIATNTAAFGLWWSNQFVQMSEYSGQELVLLRPPTQEPGGESGLANKPSQFWSVSADTENPEEVGLFLDFLLNSNEAGEELMASRGMPANLSVREHIIPLLPEADQASAQYLDDIADDITMDYPITPQGVPDFELRMQRMNLEVLFGNVTPQEAAKDLIAGVEADLE